jgi:hypothetical protein
MNNTQPIRGFGEPENERQVLRAKRTNLIAVIGLLVMIGTTLFYMFKLSATKRELEANKAIMEIRADSLAAMQDRQAKLILELNSFKDELAKREQKAWLVVDSMGTKLKDHNFKAAQAIADDYNVKGRKESKYRQGAPVVNLYYYKANKPILDQVRAFLAENRLKLITDQEMTTMTKWLMDYSVVEYYDEEMAPEAERIAKELTARTKVRFVPTYSLDLQIDSHLHWINVVVVGEIATEAIRQTNAPYMQMQIDKAR